MLPFTSISLWNSIDLIYPRRDAENTFFVDPRRATKGREELLFCPRRGAEGRGELLF